VFLAISNFEHQPGLNMLLCPPQQPAKKCATVSAMGEIEIDAEYSHLKSEMDWPEERPGDPKMLVAMIDAVTSRANYLRGLVLADEAMK
jgi:hypothetical protein